ncbi:MAG: hypothetical protein JNM68_06325 [Dinghuibacter sp.]|nr:hypothetical protein [Dinghuibacter sp.]
MSAYQNNLFSTIAVLKQFFAGHYKLFAANDRTALLRFSLEASTLFIAAQHRELILKGANREVPELRQWLCTLAAGLAKLLYSRKTSYKPVKTKLPRPFSEKQLNRFRDITLINYCRKLHTAALANKQLFTRQQVNKLSLDMLATATDLYKSIVPPPRAAITLAEWQQHNIQMIAERIGKLLVAQIDPAINRAAKNNPELYRRYLLIRKKYRA